MGKTNKSVTRLVTSGILIGLAVVLSMIKVYELPYGGSVTLFSMVPIVILGYTYGTKWGLLCGTIYAVLQALLGATMSQAFAGVEGFNVVLMCLLDYILAFTVLGLGGVFKIVIKNNKLLSLILGGFLAGVLRFVCHFLSGYLLWGGYAEWYFGENMNNDFGTSILNSFSGEGLAAIYSLIYNGSYMIFEIAITIVGLLVLFSVKPIRNIICEDNRNIKAKN